MAGNELPSSLGRVKLIDLIPSEGLPSDLYKLSVSTLSQSLAQYSAVIIQLPPGDASILRSSLESARLYFNHSPPYPPPPELGPTNDGSREWCKTSGYYSEPQLWQEYYDFRPGLTSLVPVTEMDLYPSGLMDVFSILGKAARDILDAISYYLNLRSSPFTEILDNVPLRNREVSSSVLSVYCHSRPGFQGGQQHSLEHGNMIMFPDHEQQVDKSLVTVVKSDKPGLHIRDCQGRWVLVDGDLGPQEAVVYTGLALYQATAGYVNPALHRTDIGNVLTSDMFGRCSLAFKLMPKALTSLNCSEMRAAGHGVEPQFQLPIPVDDFMQRPHSTDLFFNRHNFPNFSFPAPQDGSVKPLLRRRKSNSRIKPLPPSKRLRLEAQRVLKEKVQDIADKKGIKLRFCTLKECENHIHTLDSPCANIRMEIGWPPGVPFVHPHDLPNKAKIGFLETFEPGWTASHDMDLSMVDPGQPSQHQSNCDCNFCSILKNDFP